MPIFPILLSPEVPRLTVNLCQDVPGSTMAWEWTTRCQRISPYTSAYYSSYCFIFLLFSTKPPSEVHILNFFADSSKNQYYFIPKVYVIRLTFHSFIKRPFFLKLPASPPPSLSPPSPLALLRCWPAQSS